MLKQVEELNMRASRESKSKYKRIKESGIAVTAAVPWCALGNKMIVRVNLACNVDAFRRGWKWRNREAATFRRGHLKNRAHCLKSGSTLVAVYQP